MDLLTLHVQVDRSSGHKVVNLRYELLHSLGQGQFGKVLLAKDISVISPQYYAIKTINRIDTARLITKTYLSHTTKIKREIRIMKECDHPNVVKLYQVIDDMKYDKILLVLEYCQYGEIDWKKYNHYHEKYFKEPQKALPLNKILRDVANGLQYLHQLKNIIHRDLKPSNLLISRDRTIKISDFGVSLILENNANDDKELGKTMGTPAFFAPELCQFVNKRLLMLNDNDIKVNKIDVRVDLWSLGVVLYCLFFHQLPFEGRNEYTLFQNIVNGPLRFPRTVENSKTRPQDLKELEYLEDLVSKLLMKDQDQRPTLEQIKAHPFTLFGLLKDEIAHYNEINEKIFRDQIPSTLNTDNTLTGRLRRLFVGKSSESSPRPTAPVPLITKDEAVETYKDLEKVDDLLDSYFDDSSSMGSFEGDTSAQLVDTKDLLSSIENSVYPTPEKDSVFIKDGFNSMNKHLNLVLDTSSSKSVSPMKSGPSKTTLKKSASSVKSASPTKLCNNSFGENSSKSCTFFLNAPPPLQLSESNFLGNTSKVSNTSSNPKLAPTPNTHTLNSGSNTVTIGAGSPLSIKSMFSPSRRFFAKLRKEKKPTIGLLASSDQSDGYGSLEPPPGVGGTSRNCGSRRGLTTSVDSVPWKNRNNSISSTGLNMPVMLSSSSSSLNLHGYLMDSADSIESSSPLKISCKELKDFELRNGEKANNVNDRAHVYKENFSPTYSSSEDGPENKRFDYSILSNKKVCDHKQSDNYADQNETEYNEEADRTFSMDEYLDRLSARP